jgi:hypothetical protein
MVIKRVGPLSVAKVAALLYAVLGLIFGGIFSLIALAGGFAAASQDGGGPAAVFGAVMGVGAVIILPLVYACMGFVGALLMTALYNIAAGIMGGITLDVE